MVYDKCMLNSLRHCKTVNQNGCDLSQAPFCMLIVYLSIFFYNVVKYFSHFKIKLFILFLLSHKSSPCIINMSTLSYVYITFSPSYGLSFHLLNNL